MNNEIPLKPINISGVRIEDFGNATTEISPSVIPEPVNTSNDMSCKVPNCKKKAVDGIIGMALCEDHLHLMYRPTTYKRPMPKIGRNEPCFCGSTKKFKKCCGK